MSEGHAEPSVFQILVDRAPDPVAIECEGRLVYANASMAAYLGYERPADLVGKTIADLVTQHVPPEARAATLENWVAREPTIEVRLLRVDGQAVVTRSHTEDVLFGGKPARGGFLHDITQRANSEQNFRTIIERSPLPMCVSRLDRNVYVNPAMFEYLGYDAATDLVGPTLAELSDEIIHPDDRERTRKAFQNLFAGLKDGPRAGSASVVRTDDVRLRRKSDGGVRFCDMHGVVVVHDGSPALVTYLHDHTARKTADERLRLADRMSALGTLAAGVAHEINNPLAYVMANVEFVVERVAEGTQKEVLLEPLRDMRMGLHRIKRIVDSLKAFSRGEDERLGAVDVVEVMESCIAMAESHLRHRGRLVRSYDRRVPGVRGNDARVAQVFLNLLINAAQSLDEAKRERNEVTVRLGQAGDRVCVEVSDTGVGIAAGDLARIFDPFFTTKPVGAGTGLGLSICHGIVTALGGEIAVESVEGRGTTVRVLLPLSEPTVPAAVAAPARRERGRRGRVLIVDDEPKLLRAIKRVLEDEHEVVALGRADAALSLLRDDARFDVILCDLMMPEMSGMELFATLRTSYPDLARRVVFLTGGAVTVAAARLLEDAPNARLEKPFDAERLLRVIRDHVED